MSPRPRVTEEETTEQARRLVEATFRVVAETGDGAPPVRSILREAGLGRQQFYRCFDSKDELMAAVLAEGRRILADYLTARMARAATPEEKVRAWVTGVMRQAQSAPERTRPFIVAPSVAATGGEVHETEQALSSLLAGAIAQGTTEGDWESTDPAADALIIYDFVFTAMRRHLAGEERPTRETMQHLGDFAVRGLAGAAVTRSGFAPAG
jgi:AcrR family transcriptional regulator